MDIRKTRILHKRYTLYEWQSNNLRQGELGFLLSDDKTKILEIRAGTHDVLTEDGRVVGVPWEDALLLSSIGGVNAEDYATVEQLNKHLEDFTRLNVLVNQNSEAIEAFVDTDTRCEISPGESQGTIKVNFVSKDGYVTPGYDVEIPGWEDIVNIAYGRTSSHVYDSLEDIRYIDSLKNPHTYKVGDIIYFRDEDSIDLWVVSVFSEPLNNSYYEVAPLKTEKPELENYLSKDEASRVYATKTQLEDLTTEQLGSSGEYVESVRQKSGKIAVITKKLPDYKSEIANSAANTLSEAQYFVEDRLGNLGNTTEGSPKTVAVYVDEGIQKLRTKVTQTELDVQNLSSDIDIIKSNVVTLQTNVQVLDNYQKNHESRIQILERNSTSSPVAGTITQIKVNNTPLSIIDGVVNIDTISTDMLVQGNRSLLFDCNDE